MFGSAVLEVATGLIVCFGSIALIASSVHEAMASLFHLRATTLIKGVRDLFNNESTLILGIYNSLLTSPRSNGKATSISDILSQKRTAPSYIAPTDFAKALVDTLQGGTATFVNMRPSILAIADPQLREGLLAMYDRAAGSAATFEKDIANWFDNAMDRVGGSYKRQAQFWTFVYGFVFAVLLNVDANQVATALWSYAIAGHGSFQATVAPSSAAGAFDAIRNLPVGLQNLSANVAHQSSLAVGGLDVAAILHAMPGWLLTASAALFGAPFWFGLLGKVAQLRGTGAKPDGINN